MKNIATPILMLFAMLASIAGFAADSAATPPATKPAAAGSAASGFANAANSAAKKPADTKSNSELVTNVVGSQEAPTVLNVVPWKDKEVKLEKKSPTTSILNQVLQPLDRDVLRREVQYFRSLQDQKSQ